MVLSFKLNNMKFHFFTLAVFSLIFLSFNATPGKAQTKDSLQISVLAANLDYNSEKVFYLNCGNEVRI